MRQVSSIAFAALVFASLANAQVPTGGNVFFGYSYLQRRPILSGTLQSQRLDRVAGRQGCTLGRDGGGF